MPLGPYDNLYRSRQGPLWGKPGRLVTRVHTWLPPYSTVFDAGCGDGKNAEFLLRQGHCASGTDISSIAISRLRDRFNRSGLDAAPFTVGDALAGPEATVDCLLAYGLYHCLDPASRLADFRVLLKCVRPGGLVLFTCLNDRIALPTNHGTESLVPPCVSELRDLFSTVEIVEWTNGVIHEDHEPVIGHHTHSATWIVAKTRP